MHPKSTYVSRLSALSGAILIAAGTTLFASAAAPIQIEKLSVTQRLSTSPDSTAVKAGSLSTTLGKLRVAHKSREAALLNASSAGTAAHSKLKLLPIKFIGISHGIFPINLANLVTEPSSQYASAPKDMRGFCASAHASACAYLPPQQQVIARNGSIDNFDAIITASQCAQEGGKWNLGTGGLQTPLGCDFYYPAGVTVHFNPKSGKNIAQSAICNSPWTYGVDVHGAVWISLSGSTPQNQWWTTGSNATCIVNVAVGK